jgi:alpha-amylase/alpha-mannosidase (GH57 family)
MKEYGRENLSELSIEMMHTYLHDTIIKSLVIERLQGKEQTSDSEFEEEKLKLFQEYGLNCLCHTTTYRWMLQLGFCYEMRRKGYYVDGHEKKATVDYRWDFCERYLLLERQMFRWIQVSLEEAEKLQALGKVTKGSGHMYTDERTGNTMVEYHVDTCKEFMEKMNKESEFGGNLSV